MGVRHITAIPPGDERWRLRVLKRFRYADVTVRPGNVLLVPHLQTAATLCSGQACKPADERTRVDVELALLLRRAIPPANG